MLWKGNMGNPKYINSNCHKKRIHYLKTKAGTSDYTDGATINSSMMVSEPIFRYLDEVAMKSEATKSLV